MYLNDVFICLFHRTFWNTFMGQEWWSGGTSGKVLVVEREVKPVMSVQGGGYCSEGQGQFIESREKKQLF